jgi:hypothetical protein
MKENEIDRTCSTNRTKENYTPCFSWDTLKRINISWRYRSRWENNNKICLKKTGYGLDSSGPGYRQSF